MKVSKLKFGVVLFEEENSSSSKEIDITSLLRNHGLDLAFKQENVSCSELGVLRGMHFQRVNPQGKLIRVFSGSIFDVVLDIRDQSESFGQFQCLTLDSKKFNMLWVPPGLAHGFLALENKTIINYKVTHLRVESDEFGVNCLDPELNIPWPHLSKDYIMSEKDYNAVTLKNYYSEFKKE